MKYKLLVLDVDGTLLNSKGELTSRTLTTLKKVQQSGIKIVLASGRPLFGLLDIAKTLELQNYGGYIMAYNGAQLVEANSLETIFEQRVNPELIPYLEKKALKHKLSIFSYHQDYIITNDLQNRHIIREAAINGMQLRYEEFFSIAIDYFPCKVVLVGDDEEVLTTLENHWKRRLNGTLDVFKSEPFFLEVVHCGIDKSNTLLWLIEQLGLENEEVMVLGDGVRDVPMMQVAGCGVAMSNASSSVKICADLLADSNDNDGVAKFVEENLLALITPTEIPIDQLNALNANALMGNLGIQYTFASPTRIEATMPVDHRTRQPFGILHGGASLALAETIAGLGSLLLCKPNEIAVGMQVSGNHVSSAHEGDTVKAIGTIIHKGRSSHVWNVDIFTSTDKLVSTVRIINSIRQKE